MSTRRLWTAFAAVIVLSFLTLGYAGVRIYQQAPPIPQRIVVEGGGSPTIEPGDIEAGQNVWRSMGGMEVGSIWGHGSYVAPDWTADWLHREATFILDTWSNQESGTALDTRAPEDQARLTERLRGMMRANRYDTATGTLTVERGRADAFAANLSHYRRVFGNGEEEYAIPRGTLTDQVKQRQLAAFFFWTSWAASTNRPNDTVSYTSNWPPEELVGNRPTGEAIVWTGVSIIMLLGGIGLMAFWYAAQPVEPPHGPIPDNDPLLGAVVFPSQAATRKFFWTVAALMLLQIGVGIVTAHYGVEGNGFYGFRIDQILPYSVARTWHVQLGILWIATT